MDVVFGDYTLGVNDGGLQIIFSYRTGGLESYRKNDTEWLFRAPHPSFWRATTSNDRGSGFSYKSALWMGADLYNRFDTLGAKADGAELSKDELFHPAALIASPFRKAREINISFIYYTATDPSAAVTVEYTKREGEPLSLRYVYHGVKGLPELPVCGLRFLIPFVIDGYEYDGLSGETYPDRMKGGVKGSYKVEGMPLTPYITPQECGMHMDAETLKIKSGKESLTFRGKFNFSLLPYTAIELEAAYHPDELPEPARSVLLFAAKVRGVGGINSWQADVREPYRIPADQDYQMEFSFE